MPYQIIEPHPSISKKSTLYLNGGRGGAGNYARYQSSALTPGSQATGPASVTKLAPPPTTGKFTSGRGGAGNTFKRSDSQRAIFSFDEELARDQRLRDNAAKAPVYHIGRGGAGNAVDDMKPKADRANSISSADSASTAGSLGGKSSRVGGAFERLTRTFSSRS